MAERWEHKIVYFDARRWSSSGLPNDLNERFDALGIEGWNLVRMEAILGCSFWPLGFAGTETKGFVAFFKRPLVSS
jgi:hypothetical protein